MNSILAKIAPHYDVFRFIQYKLSKGELAIPFGDDLRIYDLEGFSDDPDIGEDQTIMTAIIILLAAEHPSDPTVTVHPDEMIEAMGMLKLNIHLEEWEERGFCELERDDPDEYGFPKVHITEAMLKKAKEAFQS